MASVHRRAEPSSRAILLAIVAVAALPLFMLAALLAARALVGG